MTKMLVKHSIKIARLGVSIALILPHLVPAFLGLAVFLSLATCRLPLAYAAPGLINFQGRLTDSSNNPKTGPVNVQFRITSGSDGSGQLWSEIQNGVPVTNGVFSVQVGAGTPIPDNVFNTDTTYL